MAGIVTCSLMVIINFAISLALGCLCSIPYLIVIVLLHLRYWPELILNSFNLLFCFLLSLRLGACIKLLGLIFYFPLLIIVLILGFMVSLLVGFFVGIGLPTITIFADGFNDQGCFSFKIIWTAFEEFTKSSDQYLKEIYVDLPQCYIKWLQEEDNEVWDISPFRFLVGLITGLLGGVVLVVFSAPQLIKTVVVPFRSIYIMTRETQTICGKFCCDGICFLPMLFLISLGSAFITIIYPFGVILSSLGLGLISFKMGYECQFKKICYYWYDMIRWIDANINNMLYDDNEDFSFYPKITYNGYTIEHV